MGRGAAEGRAAPARLGTLGAPRLGTPGTRLYLVGSPGWRAPPLGGSAGRVAAGDREEMRVSGATTGTKPGHKPWTRTLWMGAVLLGCAATILPGRSLHAVEPAAGEAAPAETWIEGMVAALRPGETLSARLVAWTKDESGSERNFEIQMIRRLFPGRLTAVFEMREPGTEAPAVLKLEATDGGEVVVWNWDVRWRRFVRMRGLAGTENFAGTHFRLEDLGFTDLHDRRAGAVRKLAEPERELVELTSPPYYYYSRVVTRIDPANGLPTAATIYDKTGARIRELEYGRVRSFDGLPFPTRFRFVDEMTRAESRLEVQQLTLGVPLRGEDFDLEELERRMQQGEDPVRLAGQGPDGA